MGKKKKIKKVKGEVNIRKGARIILIMMPIAEETEVEIDSIQANNPWGKTVFTGTIVRLGKAAGKKVKVEFSTSRTPQDSIGNLIIIEE